MSNDRIIIILGEPQRGAGKTDMSAHVYKQFTGNNDE